MGLKIGNGLSIPDVPKDRFVKDIRFFVRTNSNTPIDRLNIIFLIFLINGIGTLLPWNMLINADNVSVEIVEKIFNSKKSVHYSTLSTTS